MTKQLSQAQLAHFAALPFEAKLIHVYSYIVQNKRHWPMWGKRFTVKNRIPACPLVHFGGGISALLKEAGLTIVARGDRWIWDSPRETAKFVRKFAKRISL